MADDVTQARVLQERAHRRALIVPVFEQQPAAGREVAGGRGGDAPDGIEAVGAGGERRTRFEAHIAPAEMRVAGAHIGRVAHDQLEPHPRERGEPVTRAELHVGDTEARGVFAREAERGLGDVGGDDVEPRPLAREGERDRARAGTEIGDGPSGVRGDMRQRLLHQQLGFGARDKRRRRDLQVQRPELAPAREIGNGLALLAPRAQRIP